MGLFHDTCTALVDAASGKALSGESLKEAEALMTAVDTNGYAVRVMNPAVRAKLALHGWAVCGHSVSKRARVCARCGSRAPTGWIQCPECGKWVGNESKYCPHCNHRQHPEERIDLAGGVWDREDGLFAQRFECGDLSHLKRSGLYVQEGSRAILLDGGREVKVLGPGRHTPEGTLRAINWFGNPPPRSVVMVDSGDILLRLDFPPAEKNATQSSLRSAEEKPVTVQAEVTLRFNPSGADDFLANLMKDTRRLPFGEIAKLLYDEALPAVKTLCAQTTIEDLVKDPDRRDRFEDAIDKALRPLLKRNGLDLIRVGAVDVISPDYEALRAKYADLDQKRREVEFDKKMLDVLADEEIGKFADQDAHDARVQEHEKTRRRRWQETEEYVAQLAADKQIGQIERDNAVELVRRVAAGELNRKDAELERATRLERYARELEDQAHALKLDLNLKTYTRAEAVKDAQNQTILAGETLAQEKIAAENRRIKSDAKIYEELNDIKILEAKNKVETDTLAAKRKILAGTTPLELLALAQTSEERAMYLQLALDDQKHAAQQSQNAADKAMTPEQLLARAAATSPDAAKALALMAEAKSGAAERVVKELKEMLDKRETHDNAQMEQVVKIVTETVKHQSTVVQAPASQVFNK